MPLEREPIVDAETGEIVDFNYFSVCPVCAKREPIFAGARFAVEIDTHHYTAKLGDAGGDETLWEALKDFNLPCYACSMNRLTKGASVG